MSIIRVLSMLTAFAVGCVGIGVSAAQPANDFTAVVVPALKPITTVGPVVPPQLKGVSGWVDVTFVVQPDGSVNNVQVVGSSPPDLFEEVAVAAVRQWRYAPPVTRDGNRVAQSTRARVVFKSALDAAPKQATLDPVVTTKAGQLRGAYVDDRGVYVFRGVHYGQSTAGAARFRPPQPVARWEEVKRATTFGDVCPQAGDVGRRTAGQDDLLPMSEDCLVLNVWTPGLDDKKRPVMVWFHGRGFYAGAASERLYDGARLARRGDVVVVSVNHRLNVFGHLQLGAIGGEEFAASGNAGVQDMQLALEWVRDNIAGFGGDGANVTIFGESGGGAKVSTLLGVRSARGLFQRGIIQSGARLNGMPLSTADANAKAIMGKLKVSTITELQALPMETLLAAVTTTGRTDPDLGPVVDGKYLPRDMFVPVAAASAIGVPVIVGSNRDEYALYARDRSDVGRMNEDELRKDLAPDFGTNVEELLTAYRSSRPGATPWDLMIAIRSNRFHIGAIRLAQAQVKVAPVYMYSFDFEPTQQLKAAHGAEIPFVFSNATSNPNARPGAQAVEDAMSEAWIAFARTGNPSHAGIPVWPQYDDKTRGVMVFDKKTAVVNDPRAPERKVWEGKQLVR